MISKYTPTAMQTFLIAILGFLDSINKEKKSARLSGVNKKTCPIKYGITDETALATVSQIASFFTGNIPYFKIAGISSAGICDSNGRTASRQTSCVACPNSFSLPSMPLV